MYKVHVVHNDVITVHNTHAVGVWFFNRLKCTICDQDLNILWLTENTECPTDPARLYSGVVCQFTAMFLKFENAQQLVHTNVNLKNIKQNTEGLFLIHYKDICNGMHNAL